MGAPETPQLCNMLSPGRVPVVTTGVSREIREACTPPPFPLRLARARGVPPRGVQSNAEQQFFFFPSHLTPLAGSLTHTHWCCSSSVLVLSPPLALIRMQIRGTVPPPSTYEAITYGLAQNIEWLRTTGEEPPLCPEDSRKEDQL